jgi:hypothetical protein
MNPNPDGNGQIPATILSVQDEMGRSLPCYLEERFEYNGIDYAVLLPTNTPVDLVAWYGDDDEDEEAVLATEAEIDEVFETAKAVLAEQNLRLQRTALTLTVVGDIDGLEEAAAALEEADDDDPEAEELMWLASFYHEEQEYAVYVPLDPMFVLVRLNAAAKPELLSDEELEALEPILPSIESRLADRLFEGLE